MMVQSLKISKQMTTLVLSIIGKVLFDSDIFNETDTLCQAMITCLNMQPICGPSHFHPVQLANTTQPPSTQSNPGTKAKKFNR